MIKVLIGNKPANGGRYEYTDDDLDELSMVADSIRSIHQAMGYYSLYGDGDGEFTNNMVGVFHALEILVEPVTTFLACKCPIAKEEKQEEEVA